MQQNDRTNSLKLKSALVTEVKGQRQTISTLKDPT